MEITQRVSSSIQPRDLGAVLGKSPLKSSTRIAKSAVTNKLSASVQTSSPQGLSEIGTAAQGVLNAIRAAYSAFQFVKNWGQNTTAGGAVSGATIGAYLGSVLPGVGTLIGGALGGILGGVLGSIKSGKHKDQRLRDAFRDYLQELRIIDSKHQLELANGESYCIGFDGGHKYTNIDGGHRRAYQPDFSNPLTHETIGWAQPLVAILTGGNQKLKTDFTGYFVNAALSNAKDLESARINVFAIFQKMKVLPEDCFRALGALYEQGNISGEEFAAYVNGLRGLFTASISDGRQTTPRKSQPGP